MFKIHYYAIALLLIILSNQSIAANCSDGRYNQTNVGIYLSGNTICVLSPEFSQEEHRSGGELWDYKKGPADTVDPTSQIGHWTTGTNSNGKGIVTYIYTGGGTSTYTLEVPGIDGLATYCDGTITPIIIINKKIGGTGSGCGY